LITAAGRGRESSDAGCCTRVYRLTLQILSATGTLTRATAVYRVATWRRYESGVKRLHVGEVGKLVLKDGIVTNTLSHDFFCSTRHGALPVPAGCRGIPAQSARPSAGPAFANVP
jgi:hypothetical protein